MATLKCLACGHDNSVGDESCSSCSSSLNLKLCSACEAINANNAERCHSCNAEFRVGPEVVTFELDAPALQPAEALARGGRTLPAVWRLAAGRPRSRSARSTAVFAVLPLLVGGAAYYFFYASSQAPAQPHAAPKVEAAATSKPQPQPQPAPSGEPVRQQAPAPAVSGRIAPPRVTAAPSRSTPSPEPKRTTAAVTHTRAASRGAWTTLVEAPIKTTAGTLPVVTAPVVTAPVVAAPLVAAPTPAASAAIMPVSESPPAIAEDKRLSVTHTKADLTEAAITTTPPAASTGRTVPAETRSDELAGCVPAVVALGLCKSR